LSGNHPDGESLVVRMDFDERSMRMRADPETFYITDHYLNYPWVLVRLSSIAPDDLRELLHDAWRQSAPSRLRSSGDSENIGPTRRATRKPRGR
jgi:hypothetical protein